MEVFVWWLFQGSGYLDALQIHGIHHGALKKLHGRVMPLQETLQFEIRLFPERKQTTPYDYSDQTARATVERGRFAYPSRYWKIQSLDGEFLFVI